MINIKRNEIKYYCNKLEAVFLKRRVGSLLQRDQNSKGESGYLVRSLYFDNLQEDEFFDKINGIEDRAKYRLRVYNPPRSRIKLEIKKKSGQSIEKIATELSEEKALALTEGIEKVDNDFQDKLLNRVYRKFSAGHYRPVIIIDYNRIAFVADYNNIRVTFDENLKRSFDFKNFLGNQLNQDSFIDRRISIIEIKYNYFLPQYIKRIFFDVPLVRSAISKYCLARMYKLKERSTFYG